MDIYLQFLAITNKTSISNLKHIVGRFMQLSFFFFKNYLIVRKMLNNIVLVSTISSVQFSSVTQPCPTLCDPMKHSSPGLPVHHKLPEFTQTHVHRVGDAIHPCHPLSSPSPPAPNPSSISVFSMSQLFAWGDQSTGVSALPSVLPMNTQDWFLLGWTDWISLQSKGLSRVFSNTTVQKHQFFSTQLSSQSSYHIHTWPLEKPSLD